MRCPYCNHNIFVGRQVLRADVLVDQNGAFLDNLPCGLDGAVYDAERPYGPFTCNRCGAEFEDLDTGKILAGPERLPPQQEDWLCRLAYSRLRTRLRGISCCQTLNDFKNTIWHEKACMRLVFPEDYLYMQYLNLQNTRFHGAFIGQTVPEVELWGDENGALINSASKTPISAEELPTKSLRDGFFIWKELLAKGIACVLVSDADFGSGIMLKQTIQRNESIPFMEIAYRVSDMASSIKKQIQLKVFVQEGEEEHVLSLIFHGTKATADIINSASWWFDIECYTQN